ncbi:hypothetical protein ACWT_1333 [Actinoplanes sp. SE50]|uniref:hypothetical protein n=1 Tax=unclassified Actinoplanes TaxID=2626549 RepID=UPI00023EBCD6|nr:MULTISPECIES: hypothetical protein [unclassified Actinoplanes]AEV82351.1 hypothetical protein ACPL_1454 [Actinoplanes sp. SE50/110]ATO80748.1 hypothetical protein ACWT_1333 [Actinoplanes sp. SE50]SLL98156.1 uncharacterized protein ACSP50_1378 [Actinoplanes sp. SE50/110]
MKLFRRRPALPAESRPPLEAEERVLAWSAGEQGVVVATNRGLWLPGGADRLGWHEIHKAAWSGRELRITPAEVAEERDGYTVLVDGPVITVLLLAPGELPDQVRSRVTRSVAYTTHHELSHGAVRVVGRRVSGRDGLSWAVRYDSGTPVDRESVIAETAELVGAAQNSVAPPP